MLRESLNRYSNNKNKINNPVDSTLSRMFCRNISFSARNKVALKTKRIERTTLAHGANVKPCIVRTRENDIVLNARVLHTILCYIPGDRGCRSVVGNLFAGKSLHIYTIFKKHYVQWPSLVWTTFILFLVVNRNTLFMHISVIS